MVTNEDLRVMLGNLDGKMEMVLDELKDQNNERSKHDERITALERNDSFQWGGAGIIGLVFGYILLKLREHNII